MSDIHILSGRIQGGRVYHAVAFHFAVPIAQQEPKAADAMAGFASIVPDIGAAELQAIQSGEVIERPAEGFHSVGAPDSANMVGRLRDLYAAMQDEVLQEYTAKFKFYLETHKQIAVVIP